MVIVPISFSLSARLCERALSQSRADKLKEIGTITITAIAGEEGKLFGSVGARELEEAIAAAGGDVTKNEISLPEGALRHLGELTHRDDAEHPLAD